MVSTDSMGDSGESTIHTMVVLKRPTLNGRAKTYLPAVPACKDLHITTGALLGGG